MSVSSEEGVCFFSSASHGLFVVCSFVCLCVCVCVLGLHDLFMLGSLVFLVRRGRVDV